MESKVIEQLQANSADWSYDPKACVMSTKGSGNNWACGFNQYGQAAESAVHDAMQRGLEPIDYVEGILSTNSLAGGTGSGLGTRMIGNLSDWYPKLTSVSQLIWPHHNGEVAVQSYNSVLSLGHLLADQTSSPDCFIHLQNDALQYICAERFRITTAEIALEHINKLIAHQLLGVLLVGRLFFFQISQSPKPTAIGSGSQFTRLVRATCPLNDFRMVQLRALPFLAEAVQDYNSDTWQQLLRHGRQMMLNGAPFEDGLDWTVRSVLDQPDDREGRRQPVLNCFATLRGKDARNYVKDHRDELSNSLSRGLMGKNSTLHCSASDAVFNSYPRTLTIALNGGGVFHSDALLMRTMKALPGDPCLTGKTRNFDMSTLLRSASLKAWQKFVHKAYLHQYLDHGMALEHFLDCFAVVEQTASSYARIREYCM